MRCSKTSHTQELHMVKTAKEKTETIQLPIKKISCTKASKCLTVPVEFCYKKLKKKSIQKLCPKK